MADRISHSVTQTSQSIQDTFFETCLVLLISLRQLLPSSASKRQADKDSSWQREVALSYYAHRDLAVMFH